MKPPFLNESFWPRFNTLRFRISVLYVAVIGVILIFFQGILYLNDANSMSKEFDVQLRMKADQIGGAVNTFRAMLGDKRQAFAMAAQQALNLNIEYPNYAFMSESPEKFWLADARKLGLDKDYMAILDAQGRVVTRSENVTDNLLSDFKKTGNFKADPDKAYKVSISKTRNLRIIAVPYYYTSKQGYMIVVGTPYGPVEALLRKHLLFIMASTLLFLVLASVIVRIFVISILSSVMEISQVARNISQDNLHKRIRLTHVDQEIEHLTGSLNNMIARMEKSFAHIKEFSLEMAHEVKTPLAIISAESQSALDKDLTSQEYKDVLRVICKEARRTQKFVGELLLLTKLDYRLIKMRFEPIHLEEFLSEVCGKMQFLSGPKGIVIRQDIAHEPMLLKGDKTHLRRVFFNLIDNALKFTPPNGEVSIAAGRLEKKAFVLVSDTGCGIAVEEMPRVFDKFHRIDHAQDTDPGCGLGLSIARSIIALHGGSITVHSELGRGTTFRMEFPLMAETGHPEQNLHQNMASR